MKITCPNCNETFNGEYVTTMPDDQIIHITVDHEHEFIATQTVSELIDSSRKLFESVAEDVGYKSAVFIHSIKHDPKKLTIGFLIVKKETK